MKESKNVNSQNVNSQNVNSRNVNFPKCQLPKYQLRSMETPLLIFYDTNHGKEHWWVVAKDLALHKLSSFLWLIKRLLIYLL